MKTGINWLLRQAGGLCVLLVLSSCAAQHFVPDSVGSSGFIDRKVVQTSGTVRITAAVPSAEEVEALIGLDLYEEGIQPVWINAENLGDRTVRIALRSIDEEYYSPMEVAWLFRGKFSGQGRTDMERWFHDNQLPRRIPPGESRSGFIFTHLVAGTKGFNVDAYQDMRSFNFTFFIPMPGFRPDYMDVDFAALYGADEVTDLDLDGLRETLATFDCCSKDESGVAEGDPFNVVIVASPVGLRRALLRGEWQETAANSPDTALARTHHFRGRPPDGTFHKARPDGRERKELRLWLAPLRVDGTLVWLGQASYNMSTIFDLLPFQEHEIDPDLDDARMFVLQDFWYSQSLLALGLATGVPTASLDEPRHNFHGSPYFTDGNRMVLVVSESPVAMDETEILQWEQFFD